jgi:hypothetical protein
MLVLLLDGSYLVVAMGLDSSCMFFSTTDIYNFRRWLFRLMETMLRRFLNPISFVLLELIVPSLQVSPSSLPIFCISYSVQKPKLSHLQSWHSSYFDNFQQ